MTAEIDDHRYAILDVSNLAYARWHTIPAAIWESDPGTLFLALHTTCLKLQEDLAIDTLIFCFDGGSAYRRQLSPEYKRPRREQREAESDQDKESRQLFFDQLQAFRENHLPVIGAKNVFFAPGFEADDLIAECVHNMPKARKVYIVSSDEDLYQLIEGNRIVMYKPSKKVVVNEDDFRQKHDEMPPCLYASVKAWAGCTSDNVIGLPGIGIKKATKFVMGKGPESFRDLFFKNVELFNRNIQLTKLPAPGTPRCVPVHQDTPLQWEILAEAFRSASRPKGIRR